MSTILAIWLLSIIIFAFFKLKYSIILYTAYLVLVPFLNVNIFGIHLQYNLINTAIFIGFVLKYHKRIKTIDIQPFKPFLLLFFFYLIMMPFQKEFSFNIWRSNLMTAILFPLIIWNTHKFDSTIYKPLKKTFIICIAIAMLYGIFLTFIPGINPYLMIMLPLNGGEFNEEYALTGGGRVFGRISSVFGHPMMFGLFICLTIVYIYYIKKDIKYYGGYLLLLLAIFNSITCGVRSTIIGMITAIASILILTKKIKLAIGVIIITLLLSQIIQIIPGMEEYVSSISDINNKEQNVNGSSVEMRLEQLNGALKEIRNCPFVGKGYGWTSNYLLTKGDHPVLLAFESYIFIILCDNGILGLLAWAFTLILIYKESRKFKNRGNIIFTLFITYITYSCVTGEYGYLKYTILFYVLILINKDSNNLALKRQ